MKMNSRSDPLVSVTLPNYNHGHFIDQSIQSILSQTYSNIELIIVDDGSTDNSREIIRSYAEKDERVKVTYFEKNRGVICAFDEAWRGASGQFYFTCSSDDYIHDNHFFERAMNLLTRDNEIAAYAGRCRVLLHEKGEFISEMGCIKRFGKTNPEEFKIDFLLGRNFIPGMGVLINRAVALKLGGYPNDLGPLSDYYLIHKIACEHPIFVEPRVVATTRIFEAKANFSSNISYSEALNFWSRFEERLKAGDKNKSENIAWIFWVIKRKINIFKDHHPFGIFIKKYLKKLFFRRKNF